MRLRVFQIVNYKFNSNSWEVLGGVIAKSKSIQTLSFVGCNLNTNNYLELLLKGLTENTSIESLDLSDN